MSHDKRKKRVLHFAVTGALMVTPAMGLGCGGGEAEEPHTNVAAGDEDPDTNVAAHEDGEPHTNVAAEGEVEEEPSTNVAEEDEEEEELPTANPAGA
jgi:hypothetical protein